MLRPKYTLNVGIIPTSMLWGVVKVISLKIHVHNNAYVGIVFIANDIRLKMLNIKTCSLSFIVCSKCK